MTARRPTIGNPVLASLTIVAGAACVFGGFVEQAPNRLVAGVALSLWNAAGPSTALAIGALIALLLAVACVAETAIPRGAALAGAAALLLLLLYAAGHAAWVLADVARPAARTSLGPGFWILSLCAGLSLIDGVQRLRAGPGIRLLIAGAIVAAIAIMAAAGLFDALSIAREYAVRRSVFAAAFYRHGALVLASLGVTLLIGVPLGVLACRRPATKAPLFTLLNLVQTIPAVALFGVLITPLSALATASPTLAGLGLHGIGVAPALIALVLYALLPIVRNTEAAIAGIDPAIVAAARGMGFAPRQIFWRVELPLGLPVLLGGVRIVLVQTIGLTIVAALIGAGGLGTFVFQGIGQFAVDLVLLGALPAIALALAADFVLRLAVSAARGPGTP